MSRHGHEQPAHSLGETHLPSVALADAADPGAARGRCRGDRRRVRGARGARLHRRALVPRGQPGVGLLDDAALAAARAGGHRARDDVLHPRQPRDRRAARQRPDRAPRTGSSSRCGPRAGSSTSRSRSRPGPRPPRHSRAGPGSCWRCGPTAATSARATRCSTATPASSSSRCRSTSSSPPGCCETLVLAGAATVAAYAVEGGLRAARAHLLTLAALALVGRRLALPARAVRARAAARRACRCPAPPTPTSTCACRACAG